MKNLNRNSYLMFVTAALALSTLASCAAKKNPNRDAMASAKAAKALSEANAKMDKDVSSCGGQPTAIELYGSIADDKFKSQITATAIPGVGWKGKRPDLDPSLEPQRAVAPPQSHVDAVNSITTKDYISLGCEQKDLDAAVTPGTLSAKTVDMKVSLRGREFQADTIVICGTDSLVGSDVTVLKANTLVLINSSNAITQGARHARSIMIFARDLQLIGNNTISSIVPAGSITPLGAGLLSFSVVGKISGDGKLAITSEGSSYKEDEKSGKHGKHGGKDSDAKPSTPVADQPTPAPVNPAPPVAAPAPAPQPEAQPAPQASSAPAVESAPAPAPTAN